MLVLKTAYLLYFSNFFPNIGIDPPKAEAIIRPKSPFLQRLNDTNGKFLKKGINQQSLMFDVEAWRCLR